jgi:hypothetical protein
MYKTIHLYEIKLLDGTIHRGEIVNRDKDGIHLDLLGLTPYVGQVVS